jgi:hypothetical protein
MLSCGNDHRWCSGMLVIMCHNSGAGKTVDPREMPPSMCTIAYPSTIVCKWVVRPLDDETSLHVCRLTLDCKVSNCLQVLMVFHIHEAWWRIWASSRRVHTSPVSSAHLNDLHRNIPDWRSTCAYVVCPLSELRNLAVEYSSHSGYFRTIQERFSCNVILSHTDVAMMVIVDHIICILALLQVLRYKNPIEEGFLPCTFEDHSKHSVTTIWCKVLDESMILYSEATNSSLWLEYDTYLRVLDISRDT